VVSALPVQRPIGESPPFPSYPQPTQTFGVAPPPAPPTTIIVTAQHPTNSLAGAALVFAVLSAFLCWVPGIGLSLVALAVVLAFCGFLVSLAKQGTGFATSIAAALIALLISLPLSIFITGLGILGAGAAYFASDDPRDGGKGKQVTQAEANARKLLGDSGLPLIVSDSNKSADVGTTKAGRELIENEQVAKRVEDRKTTEVLGADAQNAPKKNEISLHRMRESFRVGYTSYSVSRAWWSQRLSENQFLDEPPNASYLFVQLSVRNDDRKPRSIPPFKLIDEFAAEYDPSSKGWAVKGSIGVLDSLNPTVTKQGFLVFDVPKHKRYRLQVSGGFWSLEQALVELTPESKWPPDSPLNDSP
jgi:hypothetical protein